MSLSSTISMGQSILCNPGTIPQSSAGTERTLIQLLCRRLAACPRFAMRFDGGVYVVKIRGSSYARLLNYYRQNLEAAMAFDPVLGIGAPRGLLSLTTTSLGWLKQPRNSTIHTNDANYAVLTRSLGADSSATGVSIDKGLPLLGNDERVYRAAARRSRIADGTTETALGVGR